MAVFSADRSRRTAPPAEADAAAASGFPSPARDYFDGRIDLNRHLIRDPTSTYVVRVEGDSMAGTGICNGDELIVDRSLTPRDGAVVVAVVNGELAVRRLLLDGNKILLRAETPGYPDIEVSEPSELSVWGVVTRCLHHV
ncbi:translesion error-prone DNA polymerase V autoproteolytic subunit [Arthrobacter sp. zg-Y20]|uniref:LexA family protein n=1 Tax=unclassified Arthrobacter TaxID=235627 RepID=UPI001D148F8E|nr:MULTISPECIES: translesion error-prone DNA polymerase V autoproteolytic subunit [unclassified Arthrobacter]MCC3274956.1 translesion error-prone DNA polymerase V autoproteolytic subunit [Arthrobacter sp. zg-Y20]MDK1315113.1 translesion error-prone DNA polymerase V autoproteolytic subunit [Arthrobacter sp. zg.Y20]WIB04958.1 translesion error-prone DNA polymerase V autoproteolytic subunit [Arthrobacter sp. zg-Y20]